MAELLPMPEPAAESPLAAARIHKRLTLEEAARRAGITAEQAQWLEDGRVYRFRSGDDALLTAHLYTSMLGLEHREVLELAGLPVPPRSPQANPTARLAVLAGLALALVAILAVELVPKVVHRGSGGAATVPRGRPLPPPWKIAVDVLNGSGDINHTREVASRIGALAYHVEHVGRADRFDYTQTAVFYEPGGEAIATRLASSLGAPTRPLPGGTDPERLVVIVGPKRGP
jgi:hypothetical protein